MLGLKFEELQKTRKRAPDACGPFVRHAIAPRFASTRVERKRLHSEFLVHGRRSGFKFLCPGVIAALGMDSGKGRLAKGSQGPGFAGEGETKSNVELLF